MIDWGNLRGQIFSRTGFAPSAEECEPHAQSVEWSVRVSAPTISNKFDEGCRE